MPRPPGGDDPTRDRPGGSRTETVITEESELGSDGACDELPPDDKPVRKQRRTGPRAERATP